ncbi:MAG: peptidoglycan bridge formation glycyltransferase FemA/FemB family protein [Anaerolineales bacterium]|nr:peptidoglycan bridge formation glycyltransferase FemA/FemB family protein [Anaerolineales bacterium]
MNPHLSFSEVQDPAAWNALAAALPGAHILQSWEWGEVKSRYGWRAERLSWEAGRAAAQVLTRSAVAGRLKVMYVPKGPLLAWDDADLRARVLADLQQLARARRAVLLKIDPDATDLSLASELQARGWLFSPDQVQFRNTVTLDLRRSEDELLGGMKQKTRYNIRLALKKGVRVRPGGPDDFDLLYRMYAETSLRDGFVIRSPAYYKDVWSTLYRAGQAQPFIAEVEAEPVGALILFHFARTAWYFYGMSRNAHREKMPNHLLQWEAIRWAKAHGYLTYDFWGAPDELVESDPLWGVWKFKEGFGGEFVRRIGAWDYAPSPPLYKLYTAVLPRVLDVLRRRGHAQTRRAIE